MLLPDKPIFPHIHLALRARAVAAGKWQMAVGIAIIAGHHTFAAGAAAGEHGVQCAFVAG